VTTGERTKAQESMLSMASQTLMPERYWATLPHSS